MSGIYFYCKLSGLAVVLLMLSMRVKIQANDFGQRPHLRNLLEAALLNSSDNLFEFQIVLFNPIFGTPKCVHLSAVITVVEITDPNFNDSKTDLPAFKCQQDPPPSNRSDCLSWTSQEPLNYVLRYDGASSGVSNLLKVIGFSKNGNILEAFDPYFCWLMWTIAGPSVEADDTSIEHDDDLFFLKNKASITIQLDIDKLETMPSEAEVANALSMIFVWAKAMSLGTEKQYDIIPRVKRVKSYFSCKDEDSSDLFSVTNTIILMGFTLILAKVLILIISLKYYNEAYDWLEQRLRANSKDLTVNCKAFKCWSTLLFTVINIATVCQDLAMILQRKKWISLYSSGTILVLISVPATLCFKTYRNQPSWTQCERIVHLCVFSQFLWFINRLSMLIIISIFFFIIAPVQTLGIVTLVLCTIGCYLIILPNLHIAVKRTTCKLNMYFIIMSFLILLSVTSATLLFIALVDNGLQSSGLGGFILTLIPSVVALIIGFYVNKEVFHNFFFKTQKSYYEDNREDCERGQPEAQTGATNQLKRSDTHDNTDTVREAIPPSESTPLLKSQPQINS